MEQISLKHYKVINTPDEANGHSIFFKFGETHVGILVSDAEGNVKPVVVDIDVLIDLVNEALDEVHIGGNWGQIIGSLSAQTDLANALAAKAPLARSVNAQTGTTYTIQASDNGKVITFSNASPVKVTVPAGLGTGFNCRLIQIGDGQVAVEGSGTTITNRNAHNKISGRYGSARLESYATNVFAFEGDTTKTTLLLDLLSVVPNRAYSFRRLSGSYLGHCAKVRPAGSTEAWTNIGFDSNDRFDESAALAVGSNLEILFYDQSGNNRHELYVASAPTLEFNYLNGKVVRKLVNQNVGLGDLSSFTAGECHRLFRRFSDPPSAGGGGTFWYMGTSGEPIFVPHIDGVVYEDFGSNVRKNLGNPALSMASWRLYSVYSAPSDWKAFLDSTQIYSTNSNTVSFSANATLNSDDPMWDAEFILFSQKLGTVDRQIIFDNIEHY